MSRWFRLYDDAINDPKMLRLPEAVALAMGGHAVRGLETRRHAAAACRHRAAAAHAHAQGRREPRTPARSRAGG